MHKRFTSRCFVARRFGAISLATAVSLSFGHGAFAADGDLDPTFGTGGVAHAGATAATLLLPPKPVVQADGKIVFCFELGGTGPSGNDFMIARFNADGSPDTTFDFDGTVVIDFDARNDACNAIAVQPNGKIVAIGPSSDTVANNNDFAIARVNVDGTLDSTFGAGTGKTLVSFDLGGNNDDTPGAVTLQPDGKIVVAGWASGATGYDMAVVRLLQDGSRDTTFNSTGRATIPFDFAGTGDVDQSDAVMVDDAGRIIVGGIAETQLSSYGFALARLLPNGTLDNNFNADGRATIDFDLGGTDSDVSYTSMLTRDGKIVMVGATDTSSGPTPSYDVAVARVLPDGSPDPSFGIGGKVVVPFDLVANGTDVAYGVAEDSAGRIVVAGTGIADASSNSRGLAFRLMPTGALDESFGAFGKKIYDFGGTSELITGVAVQGNAIIFGGITVNGASDSDAFLARADVDLIFANGFK
jgi:uncharacterized delta-60 repeat protein